MHYHTYRITHIAAFVTPVVEHWLNETGITKAVLSNILSMGWFVIKTPRRENLLNIFLFHL